MKIAIDAERRIVLLRWLKNGMAALDDIPELTKGLSDWARLILSDDLRIKLERRGRIMILQWLKNGIIDISDIMESLPTFAELLKETGIWNNGHNENDKKIAQSI